MAPAWLGCRGNANRTGGGGEARSAERAAPSADQAAPSVDDAAPSAPDAAREAGSGDRLERLEVRGAARARGQAHGAAHRDLIAGCVSSFMQATAALRATPEGSARWSAAVDSVAKRLGRDAPPALQELQGIAAEAGVDEAAHLAYALEEDLLPALDVAVARARIDTWLASDVLAIPNLTGRVTRLLFRMDSAGPLTLIDHVGDLVETPMLLLGRPGTLGCFGINRGGLACVRQPLFDGQFVADGMLSNQMFRQILKAKDHHGASASANDWRPTFGTSFFIADSQSALSIEVSSAGGRILGAFKRSAVAAHTNHRVGPVPSADALAQGSLARLKIMRSLIPYGEDPELKVLIKKFQAVAKPAEGSPPRLLFATNLKPSGTQLSWRSELAAP